MEQCVVNSYHANAEGIDMTRIIKSVTDCEVNHKIVAVAEIKANKKDGGGNFYIFDLLDDSGIILAKDRYVFVDSVKQPFDKLNIHDEELLNPIIELNEDEMKP